MTAQTNADFADGVGLAIERAQAHLLGRQDIAGWWKGELRTNVTMDAEDLLLRQFLGILRNDELVEAARWIRSQQRADGTWATFHGGPGELSTTIEAYTALRLAGDEVNDAATCAGAPFVLPRRAASRPAGCSPASGWRCSASGRGTPCRRCPPSWCCCPNGCR